MPKCWQTCMSTVFEITVLCVYLSLEAHCYRQEACGSFLHWIREVNIEAIK